MAGLHWMAVMLAFFLSTEHSLAAVDQNRLADIVQGILGKYQPPGMFSIAVRIPEDQNKDVKVLLQEVFNTDPPDNVKNVLNRDEVYQGTRVVAATVLKRPRGGADHAEFRVVDNFFSGDTANDTDTLLFYVYASPCVEKCTSNEHSASILQRIQKINNWTSHAFVFSKIFKPKNAEANSKEELSGAIQRLGAAIGLSNIFRCQRNRQGTHCDSCSSDNQVSNVCVSDDNTPPSPSRGRGGSGKGGNRGRGRGGRNKRSTDHNGDNLDGGDKDVNSLTGQDVPSSQTGTDDSNGNNTGTNTGKGMPSSETGLDNVNGNDANAGEGMSSMLSGLFNGNGNDYSNAGESVSSSQMGPENGRREKGKKIRRHKGQGDKGMRRRKGKRGKGMSKRKGRGRRRRKGQKGMRRRGRGRRRGKRGRGKRRGMRRGGRGRRRGMRMGGRGRRRGVRRRGRGRRRGMRRRGFGGRRWGMRRRGFGGRRWG